MNMNEKPGDKKSGQHLGKQITNSIGMKFQLIPAGSFKMGSPISESGRDDDEGPVHHVLISKAFYFGVYEVTQKEFEHVMRENPSRFWLGDGDNPVESTSWISADLFCQKLSGLTGESYRLPTEAEWEYACRAGTESSFYWGDRLKKSILKQYAWYAKNANRDDWSEPHAEDSGSQGVGGKPPNPWGLYDMSGNVWEWCSDWYEEDYYQNSSPTDPKGPAQAEFRVRRGGSWFTPREFMRSASREDALPRFEGMDTGFRIVRETEQD